MAVSQYKKGQVVKLSDNFISTEFDCHGSGCCSTTLIDNCLVGYLQQIREHFRKPITITSGYRCATHNANVGGASQSYHMRGQAADIVVAGITPVQVASYAESIGVKGIGLYDSFTHIDTRTNKSFWYSDKQEYRSTFGVSVAERETPGLPVVQQGATGAYVKIIQCLLGIRPDGIFGADTSREVINFQKKNGLTADGIVGDKTWNALLT